MNSLRLTRYFFLIFLMKKTGPHFPCRRYSDRVISREVLRAQSSRHSTVKQAVWVEEISEIASAMEVSQHSVIDLLVTVLRCDSDWSI